MRTPPKNSYDDTLLNRLLADEDWQAHNTAVRARRRQRALLAWGGSAVVACALALVAVNFSPPTEKATPVATNAPALATRITYISEEQLLAIFPPGSCTSRRLTASAASSCSTQRSLPTVIR